MLKNTLSWINRNIILLSIFISVTLLIFGHAYFFGAYISPDSTNYLRAAQSLRDGYGFHVNTAAGDTKTYFSMWPIGYPAMIAFVSIITNTEIYLASKIVSVIILTIIFTIFYIKFKKHAWAYALLALNFGFLQIFYFTWSEQPFILGLIWLSFTAINILKSERINYYHYINITLASLFLFFSRYIGAFSVGVIGLMAVYYLITGISKKIKENLKKSILLIAAAGFVSTCLLLYLFENYKNSGYITGVERVPSSDNPFVLFLILCITQIIEVQNIFELFFKINYVFAFLIYAICGVLCFRFFRIKREGGLRKYIPVTAFSFLSIGLLYWFSIVVMRFSSGFNVFSFRLIFPASALFLPGIMAIVESRYSELIDKITVGLRAYLFAIIILLSSLSSFADPAYNVFFKNEPIKGYNRIRSGIVDELSGVPPKSLIISLWETEYVFLHFTRPDLLYMSLPSEKLKQGLLDKSNEVYIYADWSRLSDNENVTSFFEQFVPTGMQTSKKLMRIK